MNAERLDAADGAEILLAEDDAALREGLALLLEGEGYAVRAAPDGEAALALFHARRPDLVLLDVMMPKRSGTAVCATIRARDDAVPILFLTARDGEADELRGLALGADDYLPKTTTRPILLARLAALLKRARRTADGTPARFAFAGGMVDAACLRLTRPTGDTVDMTLREVEMLRHFHAHPGEVFSRDALLTRFWGLDYKGNESALGAAVARLREKLGPAGARIEAVYGRGYRYRPA